MIARPRRILALLAVAAAGIVPVAVGPPAAGQGAAATPASPWTELVGSLHEHSGYSDGKVGSTPADYFASAKGFGLDFLGGSEHSDNAEIPLTANEGCLDPAVTPSCVRVGETERTWPATLEQADAATTDDFTAVRGFEWTSDRFGHVNVYFSQNYTNAKTDGGYAVMDTFWKWFTTPPGLGGGNDGVATFNHPGGKQLHDADPTQNWNDFAYVPAADGRMVGIETFNDDDDFGSWYPYALDKGWHVGAIGAEDLGHRASDDWGGPSWPKTVILSSDRSRNAMRSAMLTRRFYAVRDTDRRLTFTVDGSPMGSRLVRPTGRPLRLKATTNDPAATIELVTSGGAVVASSPASSGLTVDRAAVAGERYYFARVRSADGRPVAYSSPVWIEAARGAAVGEWLAGDLHVHTSYSHDGWSGPDDDNTGPEEAYTASGTVEERFVEAAARGLDYLAITDHNDVRSVTDPGFGTHGVTGIPGYENSLHGHGQMLGATKVLDNGSGSAADVNRLAGELHSVGGLLQANHPADELAHPLDSTCSDTSGMHWQYGFDVVPDTVEIWNIGHFLQPPAPAGTSNADAARYWECFLDRGHRVGATGGSDSHWLSTAAIQGPGNPTTWVFARDHSKQAVLDGLRAGRTAISVVPPTEGGAPLLIEGDADGDGVFESIAGDEVPPGSAMRVRSGGNGGSGGFVTVRANGSAIVEDALLTPGGSVPFTAPAAPGWVRATLSLPDGGEVRPSACPPPPAPYTTYCRNPVAVLAATSAVYVVAPSALQYTGDRLTLTDRVRLAAVLTDDGGRSLAGRTVTFAVAGRSFPAVTDTNGRAALTATIPNHARREIVTVAFAGDNRYRPSTTTATVWFLRP